MKQEERVFFVSKLLMPAMRVLKPKEIFTFQKLIKISFYGCYKKKYHQPSLIDIHLQVVEFCLLKKRINQRYPI